MFRKNKSDSERIKNKHKVLRIILKFFILVIILLIISIIGFVGYSTFKNGWGIKGIIKTAIGSSGRTAQELGNFEVLILGVSKDISVELTDTIMIASYNPETQKATIVSIPRDTFVGNSKLRADSYDKINAIYQLKGAEGTLEAVNKITGLNIKNYIVISNSALIELVDAIGGVEFDVPTNMKYDSKSQNLHINLKKGKQLLDGQKAEWLVRFRKNNNGTTYSSDWGNDDYGRMKTQREFIKAVIQQTLQAKNITKISEIVEIVKRNVKTNIIDWEEIRDYIPYALDFKMENLKTDIIIGKSARIPEGTGLWFFEADEEKVQEQLKEIFTNQILVVNNEIAVERSKIRIEILNGTEDEKILNKAENMLKSQGYTITKTSKTSSMPKTTIINKSEIEESEIQQIKNILETGVIISGPEENSSDITIILGNDFR